MSEVEDEIGQETEVKKPEPETMMTPLKRSRKASATSTDSEEVSPVRRVRRKSQKAMGSSPETDKEQVLPKTQETPSKRRGRPPKSSKS